MKVIYKGSDDQGSVNNLRGERKFQGASGRFTKGKAGP
jgi:hypothetical protein